MAHEEHLCTPPTTVTLKEKYLIHPNAVDLRTYCIHRASGCFTLYWNILCVIGVIDVVSLKSPLSRDPHVGLFNRGT